MNADSTILGPWVRSCHPNAYRSGEWGIINGRTRYNGRECFIILWPGDVDLWPVEDPAADYEFKGESITFGRVKRAAYENKQGNTEITITVPGKHHPQPGELIVITTKEGTK